MAAAEVQSPGMMSRLSKTPSSLSRTRDILIETMQLVEPRKKTDVPNHLLETKIFSKLAKNAVVQADPDVLHFGGFEPGKTIKQVVNLINVSTEVQRMHVIPPQSKYFYIKYTKRDRLVPGMALECTVEFTPDEWRYYYDCIRIHTKGDENLIIPIHAYPVMNTSDFPKYVTFPPIPIGHTRSRVIPLRCDAPIDFEFQMKYLQPHPAFRVDPMTGIVPANGEVDVMVTFSPTEFSTARMTLQLNISQFNSKPFVCHFSGSCVPGLAKELMEKSYQQEQLETEDMLDPRAISPLDRARSKKRKKSKTEEQPQTIKEIERDGVKFPLVLDNPYAVSQVLNQQPGKLRMKDLREVVLTKKKNSAAPTRQMKEAMFEMAVRQNVYEERQNQLRWQVKIGDSQISQKERTEILESREEAWSIYKRKRGDPNEEEEYLRHSTECTIARTRRDCGKCAEPIAQFDIYKNDPWAVKHATLSRFIQAARKVIIRLRADKKLRGLRQMVIDWGDKKYNQTMTADEKEKLELLEEEETPLADEDMILCPSRVTSFSFPTYLPPDVKDDMAVDALGPVAYKPTEVVVRKNVSYHDLKVPQQYKLLGYKPHNVHEACMHYVAPGLARPLRTGAEEEVISLSDVEAPRVTLGPVVETDMKLEEVESCPQTPVPAEVAPIKPPAALFKPLQYPKLHIFNPAPGLQVFHAPLPYSEVDSDFHLCPLPRYTGTNKANPHMNTQKRYLDREDTIRGIMSWKKFPSQGLMSLTTSPAMSGVQVPRWTNPFNSSMLPDDVPDLYSSLPEDDKEAIIMDEDTVEGEQTIMLTPEMVVAEFPSIEPQTVIEEKAKKDDKRDQDMEQLLKNKHNRLGRKINAKIDQLNALKTDPKLILK